ncbi:oligosaccharide flippase family protein [Sphingomonas sp. GCM10030256]|uniref:oligosaccharide flippase family protein n=1 Tax=Sphingomonas sp. GCM10030256 TaxID=3273427 RepID=UPI00360B145D
MSHSLRSNLTAGMIVQASNLVLPLLTIPLLARSFATDGFGRYVIAVAATTYVCLVVEWGLTISAARTVAHHRDVPDKLAETFWVNIATRFMLLGPAAAILVFVDFFFVRDFNFSAVAILALLGTAINTDWLLLGLERGRDIATRVLLGRLVTTLLVFGLVRGRSDIILAFSLWVTGGFISSLLIFISSKRRVPPLNSAITMASVFKNIADQRHSFTIRAAALLYAISAPIIAGAVTGPGAAGLYGGADRIARAALGFFGQISNAVTPRTNYLFRASPSEMIRFMRISATVQIVVASVCCIFIFVAAPLLVRYILGVPFVDSVELLKVLSGLVPLVVINNILGVQFLVPLGSEKQVARSTLFTLLAFLIGSFLLGLQFGAFGVAIATILAEMFCLSLLMSTLLRLHPEVLGTGKGWQA